MRNHQHTEFTHDMNICLERMRTTYQFTNMNMLPHGEIVHETYLKIISILERKSYNDLTIPDKLFDWYISNKQYILPLPILKEYHILHDCGKPLSFVKDNDNKSHFPNHTTLSAEQYYILRKNDVITNLIQNDMYFHVEKDARFGIIENDVSLYLTAWAELYANAPIFGGFDTISFKIKRKKLLKPLKSIK